MKYFHEKTEKIKAEESKKGEVKFSFWLVTNDGVEETSKQYAENVGINIMKAKLPSNWRRRADWSVLNLSSL